MSKPVVHPSAQLDESVEVAPFAFIDKDVVIGSGTRVGPHSCIWEGSRIGKDCSISPGAQISCLPQDLKFRGEKTTTHVGDNTTVREFVTISRGTNESMKTIVGSNCLLMAYVHVAHDCVVGDHCILSNCTQLGGHVHVGDHVVTGGGTGITQFIHVGMHSMIAAGALLRKNVPPYIVAARHPAGYSGVNVVGLRRRGFTSMQINELQEIYRIIFHGRGTMAHAISKVEQDFPDNDIKQEVLTFIKGSKTGILRSHE